MADPTPPAGELAILAERFKAVEDRVKELESPSGTQRFQAVSKLGETVDALAAQLAFLQSQTQYVQASTLFTATRAASGGLSYESYDSGFDVALTVTTGASGQLVVTVSAYLLATIGAGVGVEVVGGGLPGYLQSVSISGATASSSRMVVLALTPNTTYVLRTRRWWTGGTSGSVAYGHQSMAVTRLA